MGIFFGEKQNQRQFTRSLANPRPREGRQERGRTMRGHSAALKGRPGREVLGRAGPPFQEAAS